MEYFLLVLRTALQSFEGKLISGGITNVGSNTVLRMTDFGVLGVIDPQSPTHATFLGSQL